MDELDDLDFENLGDSPKTEPLEDNTPAVPRRDLNQLLRKIPVTLTLEVGSAQVMLSDLLAIEHGSVVELSTLAGQPLDIKVNGTRIGRAEVVVAGDNYGLRVVELDHIDLDSLTP